MHPDTREETLWPGYRMSCLSPLTRRRWVGWSSGQEFTWFGGAVRGDFVDSEEKFFRAWRSSSLRWRCCDRNPWRVTSLLSAMCYSDLQYRVLCRAKLYITKLYFITLPNLRECSSSRRYGTSRCCIGSHCQHTAPLPFCSS